MMNFNVGHLIAVMNAVKPIIAIFFQNEIQPKPLGTNLEKKFANEKWYVICQTTFATEKEADIFMEIDKGLDKLISSMKK